MIFYINLQFKNVIDLMVIYICCLCTIATSVEDSRRPSSPPPTRAVDRSGVCRKTCCFLRDRFALGRPITIMPAPPFFPCVLFLNADSFLFAIVVCRAFDPRPLVDLVYVSPRVVSTRLFLDIVDLVVTFAALRPYAWLIDGQWYYAITVPVFHELAFVHVRQFLFECVSRTSTCFRFVVRVSYASSTNLVPHTSHPSPRLLSVVVCRLVAVLIDAAL
jgi:hypothetical protein